MALYLVPHLTVFPQQFRLKVIKESCELLPSRKLREFAPLGPLGVTGCLRVNDGRLRRLRCQI